MSKSCKKATLITVLLTVILAAAVVIGAMFGFNKGAAVGDNKSLTVSMPQIAYDTDFEEIKAECESVFGGASVQYEIQGEMDGYDREIVFVFDSEADVTAMQNALRTRFAELTKEGAKWYGYEFDVQGSAETMVDFVAEGYVLRAVIAGVVFAVLALAYAWIRFKWTGGVVALLCSFFAMAGTAAIVVLARIPVTASTLYAVMISAFFAVAAVLLNLNKAKAATEEKPCTVAKSAILTLSVVSAVAILAAGGLSGMANLWFAVACVAGIVVAAFLGLAYAPAVYATLSPVAAAKEAAKDKFSYKGAKKTSTKVKKTAVAPVEEKVEEPEAVEEVEETPCSGCCASCEKEEVEETVEETEVVETVEETEVAEETVEEIVEETAPVEEAVEEAAEETEEAVEEKEE